MATNETPRPPVTLAEAAALPPTLTLPQAARLLGIGNTNAYQMTAAGTFPVPVLRLGRIIRIPTAPLLRLLGLPAPDTDPEGGGSGGGNGPASDAAPAAEPGGSGADGRDARPNPWTAPGAASVDGNPGPADFPPHRSDDHGLPGAGVGPDHEIQKDVNSR